MNDLLDDINVWPYGEYDSLVIGLDDLLIGENHLLLDFAGVWELTNHVRKDLKDGLIHVETL